MFSLQFKSNWCYPGEKIILLCLHYKEDASEREKLDLLSEMSVLKQLDPHSHVIRLYGCVTTEGEFGVVDSLLNSLFCHSPVLWRHH